MELQTVLITGANKGIGLETARKLAREGYYVFIGSRNQNNGEQAVNNLKAEGLTNVELLLIDVSDNDSVSVAYNALAAKTDKLDVLINNAGISGIMPQAPSAASIDNLKNVFETNFFGTIRATTAFMPLLKNADNPRIVNVSSDLASLTLHNDPSWPYYNFKGAAYGPSKTALNAYTVALAFELRDRFQINAVNPGYTATDFNGFKGTQTADDAANIIVKYATLGPESRTGKFVSRYGETPW